MIILPFIFLVLLHNHYIQDFLPQQVASTGIYFMFVFCFDMDQHWNMREEVGAMVDVQEGWECIGEEWMC